MRGVAEQPATLSRLRRPIQRVLILGAFARPLAAASGEGVHRRRGPEIADLPRSCVLIRGDRRRRFRTKARSYPAKIARDLTELPNFRLGAPQSKTQQSNGFDGVRLASAASDIPVPQRVLIWRNLQ
jgi:hypothetical protein